MSSSSRIPGKRIISLIILFSVLVGLCFYYEQNFREHQNYPTLGAVVTDYPQGEIVSVSGTVTQTFPHGFYMQDHYADKKVTFKVYSDINVNPGDKSQVLGVLGVDYQITPSKIIIADAWIYYFVLVRSLVAFFFLLFIFNRYWRFVWDNYEFIRR